MAAIKYDVADVESGGGGEEPQPGTYPGKIVAMTHRSKLSDGKTPVSDLEVVVDIGKEYVRLWTYVKLPDDPNWNKESHGWKLRELTDALGLPPKGAIDPVKIGKEKPPVLVKVTADTHRDSGDYRGRVKNLFPIGDQKPPSEADEPDAEGGGEGPYPREEIESWDDSDIRGYAEELGVENITGRGWKTKLIDAIISAQDEAAGEGGAEPDADAPSGGADLSGLEEDVATEVNNILGDDTVLNDWSDEDLQWFVEGLGVGGNIKTTGRGWQAKARGALAEYVQETYGGEGGGEASAEGEAVEDDMDDIDEATGEPVWSDQDLKDEIASRNEQGAEIKVQGRWTRDKAIAALREDNANAEPF